MLHRPLEAATATGQLLAARLTALVGGLQAGSIPASIGHRLAEAVGDAERRMARQAALGVAVDWIDGGQGLSRWQIALRLEQALRRFQGCGYRRILEGGRRASALDRAFVELLNGGPTCARKLWQELRGLPAFGQ